LTNNGRFFLAFAFDLHNMNNAKRYYIDKTIADVGCDLYFAQSPMAAGGINNAGRFIYNAPEVSGGNVFVINQVRRVFETGSDRVFGAALQTGTGSHHKVKTEDREQFLIHDQWLKCIMIIGHELKE
jgi:hypothetical protein